MLTSILDLVFSVLCCAVLCGLKAGLRICDVLCFLLAKPFSRLAVAHQLCGPNPLGPFSVSDSLATSRVYSPFSIVCGVHSRFVILSIYISYITYLWSNTEFRPGSPWLRILAMA